MDKKDFFDRFGKLLQKTKDEYDLDTVHDAFIVWFGENYLSLDPDDVKERIVIDKHAEGIDAIFVDQINFNLYIIQAKTVDDFGKTSANLSEKDVQSTLEGCRLLLRGDYKGKITPKLENLVDEYHELDKTGEYETTILFLILKQNPIDEKFADTFKADFRQIRVEYFNFDWFYKFYNEVYLTRRAKPPEKISFEILTNVLTKDNPTKARVFTCKGKELAKIYNDNREKILEQNVRLSLGIKSKSINKQIYDTAVGSSKSINFWYFNNGITIVCDEINETASGKVINLKNAQIINGAQTTYALFEAYQKGTLQDNIEVLIKVIQTNDKNFIENVTLYTNSQNAIRLRDLCSNDDIQFKIQKILLNSYGYFYERKRGEFNSLYPTPDAKSKLLGADYNTKLISNENAAQAFLAMYLNKPAEAKAQKNRIFMKETGGFYEDIFNEKDDILAEKFLMSWRLLKYTELKKKQYKEKYKVAEDLKESERNEIYKFDFLLHSENFILNLYNDFLRNEGFDIANKDNLLKIITKIESNDIKIQNIYDSIKNELSTYLEDLKKTPKYYHTKFFKNEKSIGLIRNFFKGKFDFIEVI